MGVLGNPHLCLSLVSLVCPPSSLLYCLGKLDITYTNSSMSAFILVHTHTEKAKMLFVSSPKHVNVNNVFLDWSIFIHHCFRGDTIFVYKPIFYVLYL